MLPEKGGILVQNTRLWVKIISSQDVPLGCGRQKRVNPLLREAGKEKPANRKAFGASLEGPGVTRGRDRTDWVLEQGGLLFNSSRGLGGREGAVRTSSG